MRRLAVLFVAVLFLAAPAFTQEQAQPVPLDWSLFPVTGDKDRKEKEGKIRELYSGKRVSVEGKLREHSNSARHITVEVLGPGMKRGELVFAPGVLAKFQDVRPEPIRALTDTKIVVRIEGRMNDRLILEESKLVPRKKAKPTKPTKP